MLRFANHRTFFALVLLVGFTSLDPQNQKRESIETEPPKWESQPPSWTAEPPSWTAEPSL